jgi:signal transduction histidine kinase
MLDPRQPRLPVQPPSVTPPPPFAERRVVFRRAEDQATREERAFLARALDALAADAPAEERLGILLKLLARTAGARRVAVLADGLERRAAVSLAPGEDPAEAEALAAWLDATSDRSRAERAAAGPAPVSIVTATAPGAAGAGAPRPHVTAVGTRAYTRMPVPRSGGMVLGFEFDTAARAGRLAERVPAAIARHATVALAVVSEQLAAERDGAIMRSRDAERTQFVSTVAHELRTPLTGLRGYLELMIDGKVDDPDIEREFLARSRAIVGSMAELVGDLLELSSLESGTLELELEPFSVAEAAGRVAAGLLPIAIERDIRLTTDLPPRLQSATGDRRRVEQIITNLAGNALKFTPGEGTVDIVGRFDGGIAVLIVRDDGPGIEPADRSRIFERFERLAGHEMIAGTGLGLPIARDLARRMGGDLAVGSVPGSGSAFILVLPGPAPAAMPAIEAALDRALAAEEQGLEERAVLRALAGAQGAGPDLRIGGFGDRSSPSHRGRAPELALPHDG